MKTITFTTNSGNNYLYSPNKKEFIPIQEELFEEINSLEISKHSNEYLFLQKKGYFEEIHLDYNTQITEDDLEYSLSNLPQIIFEVTSACNLRCEYCCYGHGYETFKNRDAGQLSLEKAKVALDYISKKMKSCYNASSNTPFVISFYGGEPLLNMRFIKKVVEYSKTLYFKDRVIKFSLTTNATLLNKNIDFLKENDFHILVSLDGDKETNRYRKLKNNKNSYTLVIENLKAVKLKYPDYFKTIRYNAVYTNISNIDSILSFFKKELGCYPTLNALHEPDVSAPGYDVIKQMMSVNKIAPITGDYDNEVLIQIPLHKRIADTMFKLTRNYYNSELDLFNKEESSYYPTGTCIPFSKRLFVSNTGSIHPCEKVCRDRPLGYVTSNSVVMPMCKIIDEFNNLIDKAKSQCSSCYMQYNCSQCGLNFKNGRCGNHANELKFKKYLIEVFNYIELNPKVLDILESNIVLR